MLSPTMAGDFPVKPYADFGSDLKPEGHMGAEQICNPYMF